MTTAACRGFVYATAVMGVTGARESTSDLAAPLVARTRAVTDLPVGVGLGVSNGAQAAEVARTPTASSSGRRSCAGCSTPAPTAPPAWRRSPSCTRDLADGVRRA